MAVMCPTGTGTYNSGGWSATAGTGVAVGSVLVGLLSLKMRKRTPRVTCPLEVFRCGSAAGFGADQHHTTL